MDCEAVRIDSSVGGLWIGVDALKCQLTHHFKAIRLLRICELPENGGEFPAFNSVPALENQNRNGIHRTGVIVPCIYPVFCGNTVCE